MTRWLALAAVAAAAGTAAGSAHAVATPTATGCPAGFALFSTATPPYGVPGLLDAAGNRDGLVCARALPDAVRDAWCAQGQPGPCLLESLGVPLYEFFENTTTTPSS